MKIIPRCLTMEMFYYYIIMYILLWLLLFFIITIVFYYYIIMYIILLLCYIIILLLLYHYVHFIMFFIIIVLYYYYCFFYYVLLYHYFITLYHYYYFLEFFRAPSPFHCLRPSYLKLFNFTLLNPLSNIFIYFLSSPFISPQLPIYFISRKITTPSPDYKGPPYIRRLRVLFMLFIYFHTFC